VCFCCVVACYDRILFSLLQYNAKAEPAVLVKKKVDVDLSLVLPLSVVVTGSRTRTAHSFLPFLLIAFFLPC
jgi:hypothetical protein